MGLFRKDHRRRNRRFALEAIAKIEETAAYCTPEKLVEVTLVKKGFKQLDGESILDTAARFLELNSDELRSKILAAVAGEDLRTLFPGKMDPIETAYSGIAALWLCLRRKKET
jgi:hypothetical protein